MSFFDKARAAVADVVQEHEDTIAAGLDKVAALADERTGGKHSDKLAIGAGKAKEALHRLAEDGPR